MSFEVLPLSCAAFGAEAPEAPEACARTSSDIAKYQWPRLEFERFGAWFPTLRHVLQLCIDFGRQALNHLFSSNPPGPALNGNHFCFVVRQNDFLVAYLSIVPTRVIARMVSKGNVRTASTTKIEHLDVDCLCTMMYYKKISTQWCTYHKKVSGLTTYNWWWISGHPNQSPSPGPSCCWAVVVWLPRICTELHTVLRFRIWLCAIYWLGLEKVLTSEDGPFAAVSVPESFESRCSRMCMLEPHFLMVVQASAWYFGVSVHIQCADKPWQQLNHGIRISINLRCQACQGFNSP